MTAMIAPARINGHAGPLKAPFPYFGGKAMIAAEVWARFGAVANYVEPFFGSGAVLLGRPQPFEGIETVNDADGLVSNFWRALQADRDAVAHYADWPVNENDLHARHVWLVGQKESLQARLEGDPDYFDAKVAGWWCWGMCSWIGSEFCSGKGPWQVAETDAGRKLVDLGNAGQGVKRKLVHLGNVGQGVNRKRVHLGNAGRGVKRKLVDLGNAGRGVNRKRIALEPNRGATRKPAAVGTCADWSESIHEYMQALADRLRRVRVCCGDWSRVCGATPTVRQGLTAVFLDPPYAAEAGRDPAIYRIDCGAVAHAVRAWAVERGEDPRLRIALCGYEGEHALPENWQCLEWKASGGYGSQSNGVGRQNATRERIWFSPHCVRPEDDAYPLFAGLID